MNKEQILKVADFLACNCDGHAICEQSMLAELARETGLTYKSSDKKHEVALFDSEGKILVHLSLTHQGQFKKEIEEEGRGGQLAVGDWWGFSACGLVDTLAYTIAGYRSHKNGRGSRFWDNIEAMRTYAEKLES